MLDGMSQYLTFIRNTFLSICGFIPESKLMLYAFLIPIVFAVLAIAFDFLFDLGHVLDGIMLKTLSHLKVIQNMKNNNRNLENKKKLSRKKPKNRL